MNEFIHLFVCFILFGFASNSLKDFPSTFQVAKSGCVCVFSCLCMCYKFKGFAFFLHFFWICFNQLERHTRVLALSLCVLVEICVSGSAPIPSIGMCVCKYKLTFFLFLQRKSLDVFSLQLFHCCDRFLSVLLCFYFCSK